jgi:quinol monooxygenase YgiN
MAEFVQIIRFKSDVDVEKLREINERYREATKDTGTYTEAIVSRDLDTDEYVVIVSFPSREAADRNNELPETAANAQEMSALATAPPTFSNLEVIERG